MATFWALTIWQPWATLIMEGWKPFEFRGWAPPTDVIGEEMAIHAGARGIRRSEITGILYNLERGGDEARATGLTHPELVTPFLERVLAAPRSLPMAAVLGYATIGQPLQNQQLADKLGVPRVNDSDRDEDSNWGWPLLNVRPERPIIPTKGKQGLWVFERPARITL